MQRRTLLLGAFWGTLGSVASACRATPPTMLRVEFLDRSVPSQVLKAFRKQVQPGTRLVFEGSSQLLDIFQQLQQWQTQELPPQPLWQRWLPLPQQAANAEVSAPDLVTLGDYWLSAAIQQGLLQPLTVDELSQWSQLPTMWQAWVTRNLQGQVDAKGAVWGAPYRVQGLMLAYQQSIFNQFNQRHWQPTQWADLWRPELKGRIAVLNHPRVVLSLALKVLGYSVNDENAIAQPEVQKQLQALYQQVRTFDSETALKALINEDIWLAVGWSSDILAALDRYQTLRAAFPKEGTIFSSDLWVKPTRAKLTNSKLAADWIDFCWQTSVATQISLTSQGISPIFLSSVQYPDSLSSQAEQLPDPEILARSELLYPLSATGQAALEDAVSQLSELS